MEADMQKKTLVIILGIVFAILALSWFVPVRASSELKDLGEYSQEQVVLLCKDVQVVTSDRFWYVTDSHGIEDVPEYVDVIGEIPQNYLKSPIYTYCGTQFVFVGVFLEDNPEVFVAISWEAVGRIERPYGNPLLMPYYFNVWEIRL